MVAVGRRRSGDAMHIFAEVWLFRSRRGAGLVGGSLQRCCVAVSYYRIVAGIKLAAGIWLKITWELAVRDTGAVSFNLHDI